MKEISVSVVLHSFLIFVCLGAIQCQNNNGTINKETHKGLFLTPLIRNGSTSAARTLSEVDPELLLGIRSHSGYITVKDEYNSNLFFWFFPLPDMKEKPWIIWLQGGPGYSSLVGLFDLIGPVQIENEKVKLRDVTWARDYSLLFLDNPVGAGFSFTDDDRGYPDNEDDVGGQMYEFLQQFLQVFPELRGAPLFVAGESYAGKYVPALGLQIHRRSNNTHPVNLKGIAIGNGLIDMRSMMHYSYLCRALGLLVDDQLEKLQELEQSVVTLIDQGHFIDASNKFNETVEYIKKHTRVSVYNFLEDLSYAPAAFEDFIQRSDVREKIHAGDTTFDLNNQLVYQKMLPDISNTTKPFVEELLEHYGVLCYSGQLDIILAYSLSRHTYDQLQWSGRNQYVSAPRRKLFRTVDGTQAPLVGYKKSGGNFVEVLVRGAGHRVPADQPEAARFIIDAFIRDFK